MGVLERLQSRRTVSLSSRHIVGRSRACLLHLDNPTVSGAHALIEWTDAGEWAIRDLGSKNGTFIDGRRLAADAAARLATGTRIAFGGESEVWKLVDARAPGPVAASRDGEYRYPELGMIALPSVDEPTLTVFVEDERCFVDGDSGSVELADGARLSVADSEWTLLVPEVLRETARVNRGLSLRDVSLSFVVSRDEENVELEVSGDGMSTRVPHRSYHYLLLTLARARLEEAKRGDLTAGEQGWIDSRSLQDMLRVDPEQLNLHVFRARRQMAALGVRDAALLVERRAGSRQLRLGLERVSVVRA